MTVKDLAVMGATLADGGVNPVSGERVIDAAHCKRVLAVLAASGLYELSGDWLYEIGLPGKTGSVAGSSRFRLEKAGWAPSRRRSTRPATASRASSPPSFCPRGSD